MRRQLARATDKAVEISSDIHTKVSHVVPDRVKDTAGAAVHAALVPTIDGLVKLLHLLNDAVAELTDPDVVLQHHRKRGRAVSTIQELRGLDLEALEEFGKRSEIVWRAIGALEGGGMGAIAMIPVPVVGSSVAIGLDIVAMQLLSTAVATRICYSYGFDAREEAMREMVERIIRRSYLAQVGKAEGVRRAAAAFDAARGRVKWSPKIRQDHELLEVIEDLLKKFNGGKAVPIKEARAGLPYISVVLGAGVNQHVLQQLVRDGRAYAATRFLVEKYDLQWPDRLLYDEREIEEEEGAAGVERGKAPSQE